MNSTDREAREPETFPYHHPLYYGLVREKINPRDEVKDLQPVFDAERRFTGLHVASIGSGSETAELPIGSRVFFRDGQPQPGDMVLAEVFYMQRPYGLLKRLQWRSRFVEVALSRLGLDVGWPDETGGYVLRRYVAGRKPGTFELESADGSARIVKGGKIDFVVDAVLASDQAVPTGAFAARRRMEPMITTTPLGGPTFAAGKLF